MTNAERQARYRARLKERASAGALGERARTAAEEAVAALWSFFNRPGPTGERWDDVEGCATLADYRAQLARDPAALVGICRDLTTVSVGMTPQELRAIGIVVELADALALAGGRAGA